MLKTMDLHCRICGSSATEVFLVRYAVPVLQNLPIADEQDAIKVPRGDLVMAVCYRCGFVFNAAFDPEKIVYGPGYENNQAVSQVFAAHIKNLVDDLIHSCNVRRRRVVDLGCGNGSFLRELLRDESFGNIGTGYDPSYTGPLSLMNGRLKFEPRYYETWRDHAVADVVICRHVIEHVSDPMALIRAARTIAAESESADVFFETPSVEWILQNHVFWDFFYEHCSLFSGPSLATTMEACELQVQSVLKVFGEQYLMVRANARSCNTVHPEWKPGQLPKLAHEYAATESALIRHWRQRAETLRSSGGLAVWGAGAKGVTFANLIDPTRELIDCLVDVNPQKQGRFVPGSGHPIVSPGDLPQRAVTGVILMNPNYRAENARLLRENRIVVQLID